MEADNWGAGFLERVEQADGLQQVVDAVRPVAAGLIANERVRAVVYGDATGVPLQGVFTDLPFGAWWMAQFLDLFDDEASRVAATRLVGLGVVTVLPTALTGLATWASADRKTQRVGIVHAALNSTALLIYIGSWGARAGEHHRLGKRLANIGSVPLVMAGFMGGYMRNGRAVAATRA